MSEDEELKIISEMNRYDVCSLWRFAPIGHRYMRMNTVLGDAFKKRFDELGGFTPEISKQLGGR